MFRHISKKLVVLLSDIASLWYKGEKMQFSARFFDALVFARIFPYAYAIKSISFSS